MVLRKNSKGASLVHRPKTQTARVRFTFHTFTTYFTTNVPNELYRAPGSAATREIGVGARAAAARFDREMTSHPPLIRFVASRLRDRVRVGSNGRTATWREQYREDVVQLPSKLVFFR